MAGIPLDKAEILAIFLETFLYGIFFTLFCITLYVLLSKINGSAAFNRPLIITSIVMMLLATAHLILDFVRVVEAFVTKRDTTKGGPIGYYSELANPLHVAKTAIYVTQTLTGDLLVTWRCYVIYRRRWVIVLFPGMLLTASAVTGYVVTWSLSAAKPGNDIFNTAAAWIASFFVITLCTNLYCTSLIVYRIWSTSKETGEFGHYSLKPVLLAVVESGALYASALLALLITYLSGTNGQYPALDVVQPLVGIVFSLIIIQITVYTTTRGVSSGPWKNSIPRRMRQSVSTYPMQAVSVEITKTTHADSDSDKNPGTQMSSRESKAPDSEEGMWHAA